MPEETARVARAAFPGGNRYMRLRDEFGVLFRQEHFQDLFSTEGRPAEDPARLALVTVLQFAEQLSDRQAAEAVRSRIDWKYLLALSLEDPGFDASVLSEFRTRLLEGQAEHRLFEGLLGQIRSQRLLRVRGRQRTDSTHVLAAVRALNRLECVGATLRQALNTLAVVVPEWLKARQAPEWLERYGPKLDDYRLPTSKKDREAFAEVIGRDGLELLSAIFDPATPTWLRKIPAVRILHRVWLQNYTWAEEHSLRWRSDQEIPPAAVYISSPHDAEARYSQKRSLSWVGYKVCLTETYEPDRPHLITHVETTIATTADDAVTADVHAALKRRNLLPAVHLVDTGFVNAELIVESQQRYGLELLGPVRGDYRWQARAGQGFAAHDFHIDWERQQATCPAGQSSVSWTPAFDRSRNPVIKIKFSGRHCRPCPDRPQCTKAQRRTITLHPKPEHEALVTARRRQTTAAFKEVYATRAGVEGTISQGTRSCGLRRSRYIGVQKTHLQHLATAAALNVLRVSEWLDQQPFAYTRQSAFQRLCLSPN